MGKIRWKLEDTSGTEQRLRFLLIRVLVFRCGEAVSWSASLREKIMSGALYLGVKC